MSAINLDYDAILSQVQDWPVGQRIALMEDLLHTLARDSKKDAPSKKTYAKALGLLQHDAPASADKNMAAWRAQHRLETQALHQETRIFWERLAELKKSYPHQFIAMHQGEVIDHDQDVKALAHRVQKAWGKQPVLIASVDSPPPAEIQWIGGKELVTS